MINSNSNPNQLAVSLITLICYIFYSIAAVWNFLLICIFYLFVWFLLLIHLSLMILPCTTPSFRVSSLSLPFSLQLHCFRFFLSFPIISLYLGNLAGYFLLTLPATVTAQLTQGSVLSNPLCKNSYVLSEFLASQVVPTAQFLLFNLDVSETPGTIFSIFSCWVTKDIWSKLTNAHSNGHFQRTTCEQFANVLWEIFLAIKYI